MKTPPVVNARPRFRTRVDHASIALLRSAMADDWRPERAARELLGKVHDDRRVLVLLRARLSQATLERPTRITERARVTLERALETVADRVAGPAGIPRQGGAHA